MLSKIQERPADFSGSDEKWIHYQTSMMLAVVLAKEMGMSISEFKEKIDQAYDRMESLLALGMTREEIKEKDDKEALKDTMERRLDDRGLI